MFQAEPKMFLKHTCFLIYFECRICLHPSLLTGTPKKPFSLSFPLERYLPRYRSSSVSFPINQDPNRKSCNFNIGSSVYLILDWNPNHKQKRQVGVHVPRKTQNVHEKIHVNWFILNKSNSFAPVPLIRYSENALFPYIFLSKGTYSEKVIVCVLLS